MPALFRIGVAPFRAIASTKGGELLVGVLHRQLGAPGPPPAIHHPGIHVVLDEDVVDQALQALAGHWGLVGREVDRIYLIGLDAAVCVQPLRLDQTIKVAGDNLTIKSNQKAENGIDCMPTAE